MKQNWCEIERAGEPRHALSASIIPLPDPFCARLLDTHSVSASAMLERLQTACRDPLSYLLFAGETLASYLERFAREQCLQLDMLSIVSELWQFLHTLVAADAPLFADIRARLLQGALPRVVIWGEDRWTVIVLPKVVATRTGGSIARALPDRVVMHEGLDTEFYFLQITQGFMCALNMSYEQSVSL